jgi:hypothetical protein
MVVEYQLMITAGLFCASTLSLVCVVLKLANGWRLVRLNSPKNGHLKNESTNIHRFLLFINAVIAGAHAVAFFFLPESPRWLVEHGRAEDARNALERIYTVQAWLEYEYDEICAHHQLWQVAMLMTRRQKFCE